MNNICMKPLYAIDMYIEITTLVGQLLPKVCCDNSYRY